MSQVHLGIEESNTIIDEILEFLHGPKMNNFPKRKIIEFVGFFTYIKESVDTNWDEIDFVYEKLGPILSLIEQSGLENNAGHERSRLEDEIWKELLTAKSFYYNKYRLNTNSYKSQKAGNSEIYYTNKIKELEFKKEELEKELNSTKGDLDNKSEETLELEKQSENIQKDLKNYKNQLELKKKEEDAKNAWADKIESTFKNLKEYLKPISVEHRRLKLLWGVYSVLSVFLIVSIVIIEYKAILKFASLESLPKFKEYIMIFLPLPVAGGLLWGFIFQMNRAQRQLVVLAQNIHSVEYVQGLLLAINNLSPSIDDAIIRINRALDKLIDNHLSQEEVNTESGLVKEENKDSLPIDSVIKILKEAKGIVKK